MSSSSSGGGAASAFRRRRRLMPPPPPRRVAGIVTARCLSIGKARERDDRHDEHDENDHGEENVSRGTTATTTTTTRGEELYALAEEAMRNADDARSAREGRLLREQYDAAQASARRRRGEGGEREGGEGGGGTRGGAMKKKNADRAAGMAVVKTIVKQARAERDAVVGVRVDRWDGGGRDARRRPADVGATPTPDDDDDDVGVVVGVVARGTADRRPDDVGDDDEGYWRRTARERMEESALRYGHGSALARLGNDALELAAGGGGGDHTFAILLDRERCERWIAESPVRLATILNIANDASVAPGGDDDDGGVASASASSWEQRLRLLARHLYSEAGEIGGSAEGWYNLGHLLWDECEYGRAMEAFHAAMGMGDSDALYFVAAQYLSYEEEEEEDVDGGGEGDGVHFLRKTYERYGSAFATLPPISTVPTTMATTTAPSLSNDIQRRGHALLLRAADHHGHGPALHHLALLRNRDGDAAEFRRLLSAAADAGNPDSLFLRGHCRYFGTDGHDRDAAAAMDDFLGAAGGGNADAMVSAGALLHRGLRGDDGMSVVVERDQRRAFELYQRAGELGSAEGWRNVVSCYATGQGVPKCMDTARHIANTMLRGDDGS